MSSRITREFLYMEMARLISQRGTCPRAQVGCVIVKDKRVITMGYNGAPPGQPQCDEVGCDMGFESDLSAKPGCNRAVHAESNSLAFAARAGVAVEGASLWTTHAPCMKCAQLIVSSGIIEVNYAVVYRDARGVQLLDEMGVDLVAHSE